MDNSTAIAKFFLWVAGAMLLSVLAAGLIFTVNGAHPVATVAPRLADAPPSHATAAAVPSRVNHSGDVVTVQGPGLCGSTPDALDEMIKWVVRGDTKEAVLVAVRTRSTAVKTGDSIKILDLGFMTTKIRILARGRECWVASEIARAGR